MSRRDRPARRWLGIQPGAGNPASPGGAQEYAVSGTIYDVDGTTPLSGVLVSVTGDATESVTTGALGTYSFDLSDGSYTITPTKAGETFDPASRAAEVSGSAVEVDDFSAELSFPLWVHFNDETVGEEANLESVPDLDKTISVAGTTRAQGYDSMPVPNQDSYNLTNMYYTAIDGLYHGFWVDISDLGVNPSNGGIIRMEIHGNILGSSGPVVMLALCNTLGSNSVNSIHNYVRGSDCIYQSYTASVEVEGSIWGNLGVNVVDGTNAPFIYQCEFDFDTPQVKCRVWRTSIAESGGWITRACNAAGMQKDMDMDYVHFGLADGGNYKRVIHSFWVGTGDDAWPGGVIP